MAVLVRAKRVLGVVEVKRLEAPQADHAVKFREHAIQVAGDVIASVVDVARVEAHAKPLG